MTQKNATSDVSFQFNDQTQHLEAIYVPLGSGPSAQTCEWEGCQVFADYNDSGDLIGFELLGPFSDGKPVTRPVWNRNEQN